VAIKELAERAVAVTGDPHVGVIVQRELEQLKEYWLEQIAQRTEGKPLSYKSSGNDHTNGLLHSPSGSDWTPFTCLNSLRDVEPTINLILEV
jgi:hypothetical protein